MMKRLILTRKLKILIHVSEITGYFLKVLTSNDIFDKIFQTDSDDTCYESNIKKSSEIKRLNEKEKIARMTDDEREIYLKRKLLNSVLNLVRKRKQISTLFVCRCDL